MMLRWMYGKVRNDAETACRTVSRFWEQKEWKLTKIILK